MRTFTQMLTGAVAAELALMMGLAVSTCIGCGDGQKTPTAQQTEEMRQQALMRAEAFQRASDSSQR